MRRLEPQQEQRPRSEETLKQQRVLISLRARAWRHVSLKPESLQGLRLDLPDPLPREAEQPAYLGKGVAALACETMAQLEDAALPAAEPRESAAQLR